MRNLVVYRVQYEFIGIIPDMKTVENNKLLVMVTTPEGVTHPRADIDLPFRQAVVGKYPPGIVNRLLC
jgi:hypothetical protein